MNDDFSTESQHCVYADARSPVPSQYNVHYDSRSVPTVFEYVNMLNWVNGKEIQLQATDDLHVWSVGVSATWSRSSALAVHGLLTHTGAPPSW